MTNADTNSDSGGSVHRVPQWGNWQRRCFIVLVAVLELTLFTALVTGLIVLSSLFERL